MSTTNGTMKSFKVTDKDGNVYAMIPVDTVAQQAIDDAKLMDFDPDYFTSVVSQDQKTVNVRLNGVPLGIDGDSPLKFVQDNAQGIVLGSDAPFATAIAPEYSPSSTYAVGDHCMHLGKYYECNTAISTAEAWTAVHWTERTLDSLLNGEDSGEGFRELRFTFSDGLQFVKTHPSTKILSEGFPVDNADYQLVRTFNGFIYKNITGWKVDGTVTVGLWNYDTKQYVAEVVLSSTSEQSPDTIATLTYANASDEMELHVKGSGTIGAIMGAI